MKTILVVDDNPGFRTATTAVLRQAGYDVVTAPEAGTGLELLDALRVDLLVTDVRLPASPPDGFELGRLARRRRPGLKVMYVTGYEVAPADLMQALGPVLRKPVDADTLLNEARHALAG